MLHVNDYVLEKTFVYGIVALSKWLGPECFPHGVYGHWPPKLPAKFLPENLGSIPVDLLAPPPLPPPADDGLPLRLRQGLPPASSSS